MMVVYLVTSLFVTAKLHSLPAIISLVRSVSYISKIWSKKVNRQQAGSPIILYFK